MEPLSLDLKLELEVDLDEVAQVRRTQKYRGNLPTCTRTRTIMIIILIIMYNNYYYSYIIIYKARIR